MRLMAIRFCSCCKIFLRLADFRVTAIAHTFCKYSCDFSFVAVFCRRKALDMLDKLYDLSVVDDTYSSRCVVI